MRVTDRAVANRQTAGAVWMRESGRTLPCSRAAAIAKGFIVEPGSNVSVSTRLRNRVTRQPATRIRVECRGVDQCEHLAGPTSRTIAAPAFA